VRVETETTRPAEESDEESNDDRLEALTRGEDARATNGRFDFEHGWLVVACVLLVASATLLYLGRSSAAFVTAALGISAWFLNVRTGLKRKHNLVKRGGRNWEPRGRDEE
jgi:hypothetical protein